MTNMTGLVKLLKSIAEKIAAASSEREQREAELNSNYSPRVRQVFALAEQEVALLNHSSIDTEHLLIALVKFDCGVAARVLRRKGVNLEKIRTAVEQKLGRGSSATNLQPIPFAPNVKRVLVTAQKEARSLYHTCVGTEHILLGLLCENNGVAARVLKGLGLEVSETRREILRELDPNFEGGEVPPS